MNPSPSRAVLFDLDDTLFDHRSSARAALAEIHRQHAAAVAFAEFERHHVHFLEELAGNTFGSMRQRVVRHLLDLAAGPTGQRQPLIARISQQELADAVGSVAAGGFLIIGERFANFLGPVTGLPPEAHGIWTVSGIVALVLALAGVALAWVMYGRVPVPAVAPRGRPLTVAARKDLYGDAFNESVLMRPGQWLTRLSVYFDNRGVDGLVNTLAAAVGGSSGRMRRLQTGFVRSYALSMFFGAAVLVALLLVVRL